MKVRQQGLLFLVIPVACQLVTAGILASSVVSMEHAIQKELNAKRVLSICQDMRSTMLWNGVLMCNREVFGDEEVKNAKVNLVVVQQRRLDELKTLLKGDRESERLVETYRKMLMALGDVVGDAEIDTRSGKASFSRFLVQDYEQRILFILHSLARTDKALTDRFGPLADELQPRSREKREQVLIAVVVVILVNTVSLFVMWFAWGNRFLSKILLLRENISKFAQGRCTLKPLDGNDELAEVDIAFRNMAEARWEAEERRQAIVSMVSHDLRSPLTSSGITLELLLETEGAEMKPVVYRKLRKLHSEMQRVVRLANSLLDVERIENGTLDLNQNFVDAVSLFDSTITAVSGLAEAKEIYLEETHECDFLNVFCDKERIVQILINFVSNAIKFAPPKSTVKLNATVNAEGYARLEVIDEGAGISESDRDRLFKKFSQLEQDVDIKAQGTGLGLYLSRLLAEAHEGRIGCCNNPNAGACFWIELPHAEFSKFEPAYADGTA